MDSLRVDKPDLPFDTVYYTSTTTDDVQKPYQTHNDAMTMLLPDVAPTYATTSIPPPQVGLGHYREDHTSQLPTLFSTNSLNDASETNLYDLSTSTGDSTSPTPRLSYVLPSPRPRPKFSHPSPPPPTPGTPNDLFRSHRRDAAYWSQQHPMPSPPAMHGDRGGSVGAGPSTDPRRSIPAVSELPVAQLAQMTMSSDAGHSAPPVSGLGLATSGVKRRFSEVDPLDLQYAHVGFLNQHAPPTPDAYTSYAWSSSPPTTSTAQHQAAVPANMVQGLSSLSNCESGVDLYSGESFPLSSWSSLQGVAGNASFPPRSASPGAPSPSAGHTLPQQGTSLAAPEAPRKKRRTGYRKRVAEPKDPKAAERLQIQRQSDNENIGDLYGLLVPDSEGEVPKKDRLGLIARYARVMVESRRNDYSQNLITVQQGMGHLPEESPTSRG